MEFKMKKMRLEEVGTLDIYGSAESIIKQLQPLIELYGENKVSCSTEVYQYSGGDTHIAIFRSREETDEEYQTRTVEEEKYSKNCEQRERKQFEELSKKYGNK